MFEYHVEFITCTHGAGRGTEQEQHQERLNKLGREGWELILFVPPQSFYFKRPRKE